MDYYVRPIFHKFGFFYQFIKGTENNPIKILKGLFLGKLHFLDAKTQYTWSLPSGFEGMGVKYWVCPFSEIFWRIKMNVVLYV